MFNRIKSVVITLLFSLSSFVVFNSQAQADDLKVGDMAPGFTLIDQHGNNVSLSAQKGKWVVLYFYPKDDTPGCTTEACSFRDNINRLITQQAVILGVSVDSKDSHIEFSKKHNLPFSLLADEDGKVAKKYDAILDLKLIKFAKRNSFIIDKQGKIAKIYRDVDPSEHVRDVIADLTKLQNHD
ncbi:thioredoxin-dependent thiol peroxidase [Thiomicrorhabdus hydrogeniphila]